MKARLSALLLILLFVAASACAEEAKTLPWLDSLAEAHRQAIADKKPLLIRVGASWCPPCHALAAEIEKPAVQEELARWTIVYLDVENEETGELGVSGIPALRIHTAGGESVASRDGYVTAADLVEWLKKNYEEALAATDEVLLTSGEPDVAAVIRLVAQFRKRNPALREAAIHRLVSYPGQAQAEVVRSFTEGILAERLAAIELLATWKAPVEELDPWQPETFSAARLAALRDWSAKYQPPKTVQSPPLSPAQRTEAGQEIDRMLKVDAREAEAIGHRLAGLGAALLSDVAARLKKATADEDRHRLAVLRYRLVAPDALVLRWPGGLERLAAADPRKRRAAADELAKLATGDEQPLLVELFADSDALVREFSLRGLQNIGGAAAAASLVKLLADPEPNVRAAVLKQLEEQPVASMVPQVAAYLKQEKDPDLVVHAIRFLRVAAGPAATRALIPLLKHESWQVRAEAAESLKQQSGYTAHGHRQIVGVGNAAESLQADVYVALLELLDDPDAFVVSRVVEGLSGIDMELAVGPLVRAAARHPELTSKIVEILAAGKKMRAPAVVELRKFRKHDDPRVRAAALAGLSTAQAEDLSDEILLGLNDRQAEVSTAAAQVLFRQFEPLRQAFRQSLSKEGNPFAPSITSGSSTTFVFTEVVKSFFSLAAPPAPVPASGRVAVPATVPATVPVATPAAAKKGAPATAKDEADSPGQRMDRWLQDFYAGKGRPPWAVQMIGPLEKMLKSKNSDERLAAACALVPLGKAAAAVPEILAVVKGESHKLSTATEVLPWLVWDRRIDLFRQLYDARTSEDALWYLFERMAEVPDPRAAPVFWELLAAKKVTLAEAVVLEQGLLASYTGEEYYNVSNRVKPRALKQLAAEAQKRLSTGSELERLVALCLLSYGDAEKTVEIARKLQADPAVSTEMRQDAFRLVLGLESKKRGQALAVASIVAHDDLQKAALEYLAEGREDSGELRDGLRFSQRNNIAMFSNGQAPAVAAPAGLEVSHLVRLLADADPATSARAGYLTALLGEPAGLKPLLLYARPHLKDDRRWRDLVVQAIAACDDASQIPLLREIYAGLESYEIKTFYWTIRAMTGPEILKFRKEIRDEVGITSLR